MSDAHIFGLFDFRPYDNHAREFEIQLFGLSETRESASIVVTGFRPFFYAMIPDTDVWTNMDAASFARYLRDTEKITVIACTVEQHKKLYGFDAGKLHNFVKIVLKSQAAFNKAKRLWYEPYNPNGKESRLLKDGYYRKLQLYEANIPPLLRFFHITGISPSGWADFAKATIGDDKTTSCKHELTIDYADIVALPQKETRIPFKICSFDIEASSSHGDFPVPVKTYRKLATNIVDLPIGVDLAATVLRAFYEESGSVSRVYPKQMPANLEKMVQTWLQTGVPIKASDVLVKTNINTIQSAFAANEKENDDDDDELDVDEAADELDVEDEDEGVQHSEVQPLSKVNAKTRSIEAMLQDDTWTREEKIAALDGSLMACLPQLKGDEVTFIGSTFMRYGESAPSKSHCIAVNTCAPVSGAVIESYSTEREALLAWTALIRREDPDIVIGYNIFGFDYTFLFERAKELGCVSQFLLLSKNVDELCLKQNPNPNSTDKPALDTVNVMLASGQHIMHYIRMSGRIQIDLLGYFRRSDSLASYSLDSVAGYCIGDGIRGFKWSNKTTHFETSNMTGLAVNAYVHVEEIGHTTEYYDGGAKFRVTAIDDAGFTVAGTVKPDLTSAQSGGSKKARWCLAKDDVSPKDLFRLCGGTAEDRAIVAKYCIQDCNLVQMLLHKRDVITGYVEMAKICSVPIGFLVLRGQGIKLTSYIAKKCRDRNTLMPVINKGSMSDGYEGAEVLTPKRGFYLDNPVACLDYASLYPSAMMSENFCHSSKVWTKQYDMAGNLVKETGEKGPNGEFIFDDLDTYGYVDVPYDTYKYIFTKPGIAPKKVISGHKVCRFAQYPDGERAIMPAILEDLLKARKATRRLLKDEQDEFMQSVLEQRQLGYKLTANSLYGQCGAKTSTFYEIDIAACTTAIGQKLLNYGKRIVEECYGDAECETANHGTVLTKAEYIYGDSVAKWTPVYVSMAPTKGATRVVDIIPIEELADRYGQPMGAGSNVGWSVCLDAGRGGKEVCDMLPGVETWTEAGWTRLERVIRHELAPTKRMLRVTTPMGLVDVTDDHSLLLQTGEEVSPTSVCKAIDAGMQISLMHSPPPRRQCTAVWWRDDPVKLQRYYGYECRFNQFGEWLRIILGKSTAFKFNGRVMLEEIQQTLAAVIYYTATEKFGFDVGIQIEPSVTHVQYERQTKRYIVLTIGLSDSRTTCTNVIDVTEIQYSGPVYDLTTANHHFAAGIGQLVVHNTDSVFFTFNLCNLNGDPIRGKDALEITIELAQEAGHLASKFLKPPHDFEYEKTFMPFLLLSKKRYVGMLYELNHERPEKRKEMGIVLKRRDNAPCVKDVYGGIIDTLMSEQRLGVNNLRLAIAFLRQQLQAMVDGLCPMSKLIISKSLRGGYKNPRAIAHAVLANRITEREPGNKPTSGDRIQYIYFIPPKAVKLQGDRIETPQYIIDNKLPIDYAHYVSNQIMKPVSQIFERLIEDIIQLDNKPQKLTAFRRELAAAIAAGTEDKFRTKKVEELLFQPYLRELGNKKNGNKALTAFFIPK